MEHDKVKKNKKKTAFMWFKYIVIDNMCIVQ